MGGGSAPTTETKTVVVLGTAYGGVRALQILAAGLPADWKLIGIDRNSHMNNVYVQPRFAVLPGHEYKSFIRLDKAFLTETQNPNHIILNTTVTAIRPNSITLADAFPEHGIPTTELAFDYAVYALGAHLPGPVDLWGTDPRSDVPVEKRDPYSYDGSKAKGCQWFQERQKIIEAAPTVLVVGGGALGIQFATDIKAVYPEKKVTLLHSRMQLLPRFDESMHNEISSTVESQDIELILGERLDLSSVDALTCQGKEVNSEGQRVVRTVKGREIAADLLLLCLGQKPNSGLMAAMDGATINPDDGLIYVQPTMQISTTPVPYSTDETLAAAAEEQLSVSEDTAEAAPATKEPLSYPNIFAIGDCADAFGAIKAGHNAYAQGEVAARNIVRLVKAREDKDAEPEALEEYAAGGKGIKISLGLTKCVYHIGGQTGVKNDGVPDLQAGGMWPLLGIKVEKDEDMLA